MSCSSIDLKAFSLGESAGQERRQVEEHLAGCSECREEVERLRLTTSALLSVADEEIPQRIAFVSDKVFEPRWWRRIWNAGPALGFAGATVLAAAIVVHALVPSRVEAPPIDTAAVEAVVEREVARRVDAAVIGALAASESRQAEETERLLREVEASFAMEREAYMLAVEDAYEVAQKSMNVWQVASARQERGQP